MGGSGGRTFTSNRGPEDLKKLVRDVENKTAIAEFEVALSGMLGDLLRSANERDVDLVQERLDTLRGLLEGEVEGILDQLFGGSVAKHTYVDGLSDIDSLLILNNSELAKSPPEKALLFIAKTLSTELPADTRVRPGQMAVTITFPDQMEIQLLPAIKTDEGLKVPSSRRNAWSHVNPETFRDALIRRNEQCAKKLIPTIKLAKAIIGSLPEAQRLSGYHVESLAISSFKGYEGQKTTAAMLPYFFERARTLVLSPIKDKTGQSVHVDGYLGPENSESRVVAGHVLERIAKRMRNASAASSTAQWRALFGLDE